jgi:hypothetical protein
VTETLPMRNATDLGGLWLAAGTIPGYPITHATPPSTCQMGRVFINRKPDLRLEPSRIFEMDELVCLSIWKEM